MNDIRKTIESYLSDTTLNLRVQLGIAKSKDEILMNNIINQIKSKYEGTKYAAFIRQKWEMGLSEITIQSLMHINQRTFYIMQNKVINEVTLLSAKKRLVKPF